MSSRVQKGNTVFRPVVKSRSKTVPALSRQPSVAVEQPTVDLERDAAPNSHPHSSSSSGQPPKGQSAPISQEMIPVSLIGDSINTLDTITEERPPAERPSAVPLLVKSSVISVPTRPVQLISTPSIIVPRNSQVTNPPSRAPGSNVNLYAASSSIVSSDATANTAEEQPRIEVTLTSLQVSNSVAGSSTPFEIARPAMAVTDSNVMSTSSGDRAPSPNGSKFITRKRSANEISKKPKRRRTVSREGEDVENVQEADEPKRFRSRNSSATPRPRKRAPSPPPYDPDADPGEEIDPTSVTMATLCSDTGQGRVSRKAVEILSNHAAWKMRNREKRARMRMLMEAKKYGREEEVEAEQNEEQNQVQASADDPDPSSLNTIPVSDETGSGFDYSQDLATSRFNVQVRIGPNGETVIDEESLVVDRAENDGTENYTHIVESDHTKFVNSGSYSKRYRGSRWTAEETELFYDALAQYGENYELIALMLPGRDRKSCKNKFKVEDKKNHARINHCLNNSIPVDMKTLSRLTGRDFSGPVPEIRAPASLPPPLPAEESSGIADETPSQPVKKRNRSNSQSTKESGVVVVGDAETFEG